MNWKKAWKNFVFESHMSLYWFVFGKKPKRLVENFKNQILVMHDGVPNYYFYDIEKLFIHKEIFDYYIEKDVLVKSKVYKFFSGGLVKINEINGIKYKDAYFLGINGLTLANSYIHERLTMRIVLLTIVLMILTSLLLIISLI